MKKAITFILCLITVISLLSCNSDDKNTVTDNTKNQLTENTNNDNNIVNQSKKANYDNIITLSKKAINASQNYVDSIDSYNNLASNNGINDKNEQDIFYSLFEASYLIYPHRTSPYTKLSCGYAKKDLNGDGTEELIILNKNYMIGAIFSCIDDKPILLRTYKERDRCWIDDKGYIHENGSNGADYSTNAVCKIAEGGASMELVVEFGTNGHEWLGDTAYTKYYKVVNGSKKDIPKAEYDALETQYGKYLGFDECATVTKAIGGLEFTPLFVESEIITDMFDAALNNKIKITEIVGNSAQTPIYLKYLLTPYSQIQICELGSLNYVYLDVDGDQINELVIDCGDTLILRYYKGTVYFYPFTFRNMYMLNTDGSYYWSDTGQNFEHGQKQLVFDGILLKEKTLWRAINNGEPNAEYYIEDKKVTHEEILKYIENNPKTKVEFSPLELSWLNKISRDDAKKIAADYWKEFNIEENGYIVSSGVNSSAPDSVYVILLRRYITEHLSTFDEIWIDKNTGETIVPTGKG